MINSTGDAVASNSLVANHEEYWNTSFCPCEEGVPSDEQLYAGMMADGGTTTLLKDGVKRPYLGREIDAGFAKFDKYCRKLAALRECDVQLPTKMADGLISVKRVKLGLFYHAMARYLDDYSDNYYYSEYINSAYDLAKEFQFIEGGRVAERAIAWCSPTPEAVACCDEYFLMLHRVYQSEEFKSKVRERVRQGERIRKRLDTLVDKLFYVDRLSKLCVLRIDLKYSRRSLAKKLSPVFSDEFPDEFLVDKAKHDLDRYLNGLRGLAKFRGKIVGYAWRMQFGETAGYHFHVIIFLNGSKVQRDGHWARQAADYWKKVVGEEGEANICNLNKKKYTNRGKCIGIGMIRRNRPAQVKALRYVAGYLARQDQLLNVRPGKSCHTFGCSKVGTYDDSASANVTFEYTDCTDTELTDDDHVPYRSSKAESGGKIDAQALLENGEFETGLRINSARTRRIARYNPERQKGRRYLRDRGLPVRRNQRAKAELSTNHAQDVNDVGHALLAEG